MYIITSFLPGRRSCRKSKDDETDNNKKVVCHHIKIDSMTLRFFSSVVFGSVRKRVYYGPSGDTNVIGDLFCYDYFCTMCQYSKQQCQFQRYSSQMNHEREIRALLLPFLYFLFLRCYLSLRAAYV